MRGPPLRIGLLFAVCAAALGGVGWLGWRILSPVLDPMSVAGGVRLVYRADPVMGRRTAEALRQRVKSFSRRGTVRLTGDEIEVLIPAADEALPIDELEFQLRRSGRIEFKIVDDGAAYMKTVAAEAYRRKPPGVAVQPESWTDQTNGQRHEDVFLAGEKREDIAAAVEALVPVVGAPADHEILLERRASDWRTYYLFSRAYVDNADIREVDVIASENDGAPEVAVELDSSGAEKLADVTARSVGRKMAIVLEGRVVTAPVIVGKIPNRRLRITLSNSDDRGERQKQARDLVAVLRMKPLPASLELLREETVSPRR